MKEMLARQLSKELKKGFLHKFGVRLFDVDVEIELLANENSGPIGSDHGPHQRFHSLPRVFAWRTGSCRSQVSPRAQSQGARADQSVRGPG